MARSEEVTMLGMIPPWNAWSVERREGGKEGWREGWREEEEKTGKEGNVLGEKQQLDQTKAGKKAPTPRPWQPNVCGNVVREHGEALYQGACGEEVEKSEIFRHVDDAVGGACKVNVDEHVKGKILALKDRVCRQDDSWVSWVG